jgi:hypothetical protein
MSNTDVDDITAQNEEVTASEHVSTNNTWPSSQRCIYRKKVTSHAIMICIYCIRSTSYDKAIIEKKKKAD